MLGVRAEGRPRGAASAKPARGRTRQARAAAGGAEVPAPVLLTAEELPPSVDCDATADGCGVEGDGVCGCCAKRQLYSQACDWCAAEERAPSARDAASNFCITLAFIARTLCSRRSAIVLRQQQSSAMDARERARRLRRSETGLSGRATPSDRAWQALVGRRGHSVTRNTMSDARHRSCAG